MFTAEEARKLVSENETRQKIIKEMIKDGEDAIKNKIRRGERYAFVMYGSGAHQWPEILEHFEKLGYKIITDETNVAEIQW